MNNYNFEEILRRIIVWYENKEFTLINKEDEVFISTQKENMLVLDMSFKNCLAQLTVSMPSFAPYKYVCFEAMDMINDNPKIIYYFYDKEDTSKDEVIEKLSQGVKFCSNYKS